MLVAIMSNTFEEVYAMQNIYSIMAKIRFVSELESGFVKKQGKQDQNTSRYLYVIKPTYNQVDQEDFDFEATTTSTLSKIEGAIENRTRQVEQSVDNLRYDFSHRINQLEEKLNEIMGVCKQNQDNCNLNDVDDGNSSQYSHKFSDKEH